MATNETFFVLAIDVNHPDFDPATVENLLRTSPTFTGWWNHIPGCFLVTTERDADYVVDELRQVTGRAHLLVIAADPLHSEGWLPARSWEWIRRREVEYTS